MVAEEVNLRTVLLSFAKIKPACTLINKKLPNEIGTLKKLEKKKKAAYKQQKQKRSGINAQGIPALFTAPFTRLVPPTAAHRTTSLGVPR